MDTTSFLIGLATGGAATFILLAALVVIPRKYEPLPQVSEFRRYPVPDKVEPHTVTMHEPAPIQTHERHLVAYVGRPIQEADVIQFPRRWDERSH